MTICEYMKNKYDEFNATPDNQKPYKFNAEPGTFEHFKLFCEYICDGAWDYEFKTAGVMDEQIAKAIDGKYIYKKEFTNWQARQTGKTKAYILTAKGKKACYKACIA